MPNPEKMLLIKRVLIAKILYNLEVHIQNKTTIKMIQKVIETN